MGFLLRKIRKGRWYDHTDKPWIPENDASGDALTDLCTDENSFSVWFIEADRSNLDQIVVALASNCDGFSNVDFALFDEKFVSDIGARTVRSTGKSGDTRANTTHHFLLKKLSAKRLSEIASKTLKEGMIYRRNEKKVKTLLVQAVTSGRIKTVDFPSDSLADKIKRLTS